MAQERGQEVDDGLAHPGCVENAAQENEDRNRQEDDAGHTFVHPPDHDEGRNLGSERQVAQRADAEAEGDGHPGDKAGRHEHDQEQEQDDFSASHPDKRGRVEPERSRDRHDEKRRDGEVAP